MSSRSGRLLSLGAVLLTVPLLLSPAAPGARSTTIGVTLTDSTIRLSKRAAPAGVVTFTVRNAGKKPHDFKIGAKKSRVLRPGASTRLIVKLAKPGKVVYVSTRPGDAARGLRGTFTVSAPRRGVDPAVAAGKTVFRETGCGGCHVFRAGGGIGAVGPNLDTSRLSFGAIVNRVTRGKGPMPPYGEQLTPKQIQDVATFLVKSRAR